MLKRTNPGQSHPELKEAVCESLINNLYDSLSGGNVEGKEVVNNTPSVKFISGFLEPLSVPLKTSMSVDAARNPIHIITQGLDLQVSSRRSCLLTLTVSFSIYVRLLPTVEQLKRHKVKLEFNSASAKAIDKLRKKTREAFNAQHAHLKKKDTSEFFKRRKEAEKTSVDKFLFDSGMEVKSITETDVSPSEASAREGLQVPEGEVPEPAISDSDEEEKDREVEFFAYPGMSHTIPDNLAKPVMPTQRWYRLDVDDIAPFVLDINISEEEIKSKLVYGNTLIKEGIDRAVLRWIGSDEEEFGGKLWGYPSGKRFEPSKIKGWNQTLKELRNQVLSHANLDHVAVPNLDIQWEITTHINPENRDTKSVHIAIENRTNNKNEKNQNLEVEESIFLTQISINLNKANYRPIQMDRIKPSYRYNHYLSYPALGFNSGVLKHCDANQWHLSTTWMPVYRQPRIRPIERSNIDVRFKALMQDEGIGKLVSLPDQFDEWIKGVETRDPTLGVSSDEEAARETESFKTDLSNWRLESNKIRAGIELLLRSGTSHKNNPGSEESAPYLAWKYMNETMQYVAGKKYDQWHLFQIAFILSQISGIASRLPCYESKYDPDWDEAVALLYFATGGGKTESFFGLLLFNLFLDRLRGKVNGVTAMIRYPLRLLTIQQAQRLMKTLAQAEQVRWAHDVPGKPFAIGFWVGGGNTPNRRAEVQDRTVPVFRENSQVTEDEALQKADYRSAMDNWNKLPECPFCGSLTGLRKYPSRNGLVGHACFKVGCNWNSYHGGPAKEPLPFYIVDEDIYEQAPAIILGTIDKLALLGQSASTIRKFVGMFGLAPHYDPETDALNHRKAPRDLRTEDLTPLSPFYERGSHYFFDPFPSLIIQDEAHLLEESLGTFSGVFETAFEQILTRLGGQTRLNHLVTKKPGIQEPRLPKVVAASATVSDPDRQMEELYQRAVTQFPLPGPDLYASFYAQPEMSDSDERQSIDDIELNSRTARFYVSILTNGRPHTTATVEVLGQFHLLITRWLFGLNCGDSSKAREVRNFIEKGVRDSVVATVYLPLVQAASDEELVTLIDLYRIALTYVTNKKGGDQIMAAENETAGRIHEEVDVQFEGIESELISGAVSAGEIENVIKRAEDRPNSGEPMPNILGDSLLRSVVATSAISHGVDVDEFNTMFFAGMPSNISEYIQSSSRVGRTHTGCSILIPTPQRRRDRYILETHDQYHRFLERMIRPAAVNRWAENALKRVLPSLIQAFLIGVSETLHLLEEKDDQKSSVGNLERTNEISAIINRQGANGFKESLSDFIFDAIGLNHDRYSPPAMEQFKDIVSNELSEKYLDDFSNLVDEGVEGLQTFFKEIDGRHPRQILLPMTSLRDVDPVGNINYQKIRYHYPDQEHVRELMNIIRKGGL